MLVISLVIEMIASGIQNSTFGLYAQTKRANPYVARHPSCPAPPCPSPCSAASSQPHPPSFLLSIAPSTLLLVHSHQPAPSWLIPRSTSTSSTPPLAPAPVSDSLLELCLCLSRWRGKKNPWASFILSTQSPLPWMPSIFLYPESIDSTPAVYVLLALMANPLSREGWPHQLQPLREGCPQDCQELP